MAHSALTTPTNLAVSLVVGRTLLTLLIIPPSLQVEEAAEAMKENLDANRPHVKFSFLNQDESGKTMLNVLNPDTGTSRLYQLVHVKVACL